MGGFPDIITTDVIPANWNTMWEENTTAMALPNKPVLILTTSYIANTPEEIQLQKMLGACKLQPEIYNLIKINDNQLININHLQQNNNIKIIFLLGISPSQLGISASFQLNYPNSFKDCIFIPALSLTIMEKEPALKLRLWNDALKPVFIDHQFGSF